MNDQLHARQLKAMQRDLNRRERALAKTLLPCPKCGAPPRIDFGFLDAPYPPGEELIQCPILHEIEGCLGLQHCGVSSTGAAHWNFRRVPA